MAKARHLISDTEPIDEIENSVRIFSSIGLMDRGKTSERIDIPFFIWPRGIEYDFTITSDRTAVDMLVSAHSSWSPIVWGRARSEPLLRLYEAIFDQDASALAGMNDIVQELDLDEAIVTLFSDLFQLSTTQFGVFEKWFMVNWDFSQQLKAKDWYSVTFGDAGEVVRFGPAMRGSLVSHHPKLSHISGNKLVTFLTRTPELVAPRNDSTWSK